MKEFLKWVSHQSLIRSSLLSIAVLPDTRTLHITNIAVPPFVDVRDVVMLSCEYDIGKQTLNSVKWYKNDKEFYRWVDIVCVWAACYHLEHLICMNSTCEGVALHIVMWRFCGKVMWSDVEDSEENKTEEISS